MDTSASRYLEQRPARQHDIRWDHPGWFIMRAVQRSLREHVARAALPPGAQVLDFGCATRPYRELFAEAVYRGADLPGNAQADVTINPDGTLPLAACSTDFVLSTQVLEHIPDPGVYLRESLRVLKPGGALLLSTHGLWIYHRDPVDYWRWTAEGLRFAAEREGFRVESIEGLMGLAAVAVQLFQDATFHRLPRPLRWAYAIFMQRLVALMDAFHTPESRVRNAMVYVMLARRPA